VTTVVSAGSSASTIFTIDQQSTLGLAYAPNYATALIATNQDTSFVASSQTTISGGPVSSINLFPYGGGYQVIAGNLRATSPYCLSVDASQWPAGPSVMGTTMAAGTRQIAATTSPGIPNSGVPIVMGIANVTGIISTQKYITAVQQAAPLAGTSDPGCVAPSTYTFAAVSGTTATIALPFGRWKVYAGTSAGALTTQLSTGRMAAVATPLSTGGTNSSNGGTLILDPRHP
jgi:hypothetical protein